MHLGTGKIVKLTIFAVLAMLVIDFLSFTGHVAKWSEQTPPKGAHDAVVVLTGGAARIRAGALIAEEHNLPLFISGVFQDATLEEVALGADADEDFFACCVTLGYEAQTTYGNGAEIAAWARKNAHNRLLVVTSDYHLDRAMLELKHAMPEAIFSGLAVKSPAIDSKAWWRNSRSAKRMLIEWSKWRVVSIRESIVAPRSAKPTATTLSEDVAEST